MLIAAGEFQAKCLQLMNDVEKKQIEFIVTKRGRPVAKLVPYRDKPPARLLFGYLQDLALINGDIVEPTGENWEVDSE
jgi:prevent-host-death family protein